MAESPVSPQSVAPEPPVYPVPQPYTANVLRRLRRGLGSWLALLNAWDFQVPLGQIQVLGRPLFLVNDPRWCGRCWWSRWSSSRSTRSPCGCCSP